MSQGKRSAPGRTDSWVGAYYRTISLALGVVASAAWAWTRDDAVLAPALTLVVIGLLGDRLRKAPGFEIGPDRMADAVLAAVPPPKVFSGAGSVSMGTQTAGSGTATSAAVETLRPIQESVTAAVTPKAVQDAADAMRHAATPEELGARVAEYVSLRTVPGLRALSPGRIQREQELFGAILELQTLRAEGARPQDSGQLAQALAKVELFWTRPEELGDDAVTDVTTLVRGASMNMLLPPVPYSFRALGMKAELKGEAKPCRTCKPLRGKLYDPSDWRAPRPPIDGCEHERGCTCNYG